MSASRITAAKYVGILSSPSTHVLCMNAFNGWYFFVFKPSKSIAGEILLCAFGFRRLEFAVTRICNVGDEFHSEYDLRSGVAIPWDGSNLLCNLNPGLELAHIIRAGPLQALPAYM